MNHQRMQTNLFQWTAALGATAVIIGAFGAHGLKPHLSPYQLEIFEKGVQYQFVHTLALFGTALLLSQQVTNNLLRWSARFFIAGIFLFSGSLYLLACRDLISVSVAWAGPVTPLGGLCFIGGWITLLLAAKRFQTESA